jgi:hypothetical protein
MRGSDRVGSGWANTPIPEPLIELRKSRFGDPKQAHYLGYPRILQLGYPSDSMAPMSKPAKPATKRAARPKAQKRAEANYEKSGKRQGAPIGTRLSDAELIHVDAVRGGQSRSAWLLDLIRRELRRNH